MKNAKISRRLRASLALMLCAAAPLAFSASLPAKKPPHWLAQFRQDIEREVWNNEPSSMLGKVRFVHGNKLWQPGTQYQDGSDWLALACSAQGCQFEPATLSVKKQSWQGHYDDQPTAGQFLSFKTSNPGNPKVIAWFNTRQPPAWLKSGPVSTYYNGIGRPKATEFGTLEARIDTPSGETSRLVPMLLSPRRVPELQRQFEPNSDQVNVMLQLRTATQRQLLIGLLGSCDGETDPQRYLLWAGDLDGDEKPDYLISFIDAEGPVQLYLSSAARGTQIVGLVGQHRSPPFGGECDGGGWGTE